MQFNIQNITNIVIVMLVIVIGAVIIGVVATGLRDAGQSLYTGNNTNDTANNASLLMARTIGQGAVNMTANLGQQIPNIGTVLGIAIAVIAVLGLVIGTIVKTLNIGKR